VLSAMMEESGSRQLTEANELSIYDGNKEFEFVKALAPNMLSMIEADRADRGLGTRGEFAEAFERYLTLNSALPAVFWDMKKKRREAHAVMIERTSHMNCGVAEKLGVRLTRKDERKAKLALRKQEKKLRTRYRMDNRDKMLLASALRENPMSQDIYWQFCFGEREYARTLLSYALDAAKSESIAFTRDEVKAILDMQEVPRMMELISENNFLQPLTEEELNRRRP